MKELELLKNKRTVIDKIIYDTSSSLILFSQESGQGNSYCKEMLYFADKAKNIKHCFIFGYGMGGSKYGSPMYFGKPANMIIPLKDDEVGQWLTEFAPEKKEEIINDIKSKKKQSTFSISKKLLEEFELNFRSSKKATTIGFLQKIIRNYESEKKIASLSEYFIKHENDEKQKATFALYPSEKKKIDDVATNMNITKSRALEIMIYEKLIVRELNN